MRQRTDGRQCLHGEGPVADDAERLRTERGADQGQEVRLSGAFGDGR